MDRMDSRVCRVVMRETLKMEAKEPKRRCVRSFARSLVGWLRRGRHISSAQSAYKMKAAGEEGDDDNDDDEHVDVSLSKESLVVTVLVLTKVLLYWF